MLLAVDAGNTNTVFAVYNEQGVIQGCWRATTKPERTADELGVWLRALIDLAGMKPGHITGAIIACVAPAALFNLKTLCKRYFGCEPLVVEEQGCELGVGVKVDRPDQVGADRLVNTRAAHEKYGGRLTVIDFGTATTFDLVDEEGAYAGGVIAPGLNLSLSALEMAAAKLPHIEVRKPAHVVGKDTVSAMQSGIFWGYVGLVEGIIRRIGDETPCSDTVIATGGLAPMFDEATDSINHVEPDLTLDGLYHIYRTNCG